MFEPVSIKVLRLLKSSSERLTQKDIADNIKEEQEYVNRALKKLAQIGVITREAELYYYKTIPRNDEFSGKMFKLYDKVVKKPFLIRGLLSIIPFRANAFFEILESEGFDREELNAFLEEDIKSGYVRRIRVIYIEREVSERSLSSLFRLYLRGRFLSLNEYEELKEVCNNSGIPLLEEDHLLGRYPPELANPALEYLKKENLRIEDRIREERAHMHRLSLRDGRVRNDEI